MRVLFHSNQLGIRGTEIALYDYAHYNETILGNESYIAVPMGSDMSAHDKFVRRFGFDRILLYDDFTEFCSNLVNIFKITHAYFIKGGANDGKLVPGIKNIVHAVFDGSQPHGDHYVAVSKWLGDKYKIDYLPHIVSLPKETEDFRDFIGIKKDAIVFGRHGGYSQFDVPYLDIIKDVCASRGDIVFLLMNTAPLNVYHDRIIHVDPEIDLVTKTRFINTCDAMIHGRMEGETFGLAIAEFLHQDKPVITNIDGRDRNHIHMLGSEGFYYETSEELKTILLSFEKKKYYMRHLVKDFTPEEVMKKFKSFL
jgi:hypothetical protein